MVRGRDDREGHGRRHDHREDPKGEPGGGLEDDDPEEDVPACVEARKGRVLVREGGRLQRPVTARVLGHRVHDGGVGKPRRGHRKGREEDEADQSGDEHRVPEQAVAVPAPQVEGDPAGHDHRPVAVDVDPVRGRDQPPVVDDQLLEPVLPVDSEVPLETQECVGVRERAIEPVLRESPDTEVQERRRGDQPGFPPDRDRRRRLNAQARSAHVSTLSHTG